MFDNLKALLIYLVVIGHLLDTYHAPSKLFIVLYYFIYFFHMPAFIFITGYFSKNVKKCRNTAFERFFIPYLILNITSYIQYVYLFNKYHTGEKMELFYVFKSPLGVWFLLGVFIWRMALKDLIKIRFIVPLSFAVGVLAGIGTEFGEKMALGRLFALGPFFLLGYYANKKHVDKIRKIPKIVSIICLIIIIGIAYYLVMNDVMNKAPILFRKPYSRDHIMEDLKFRMVIYIIAIVMIGILLNLMSYKKTIFTNLGTKTLTVYVIHLFIVRVLDEHIIFPNQPILYAIYIFVGAAFITYLCSRNVCSLFYDKTIHSIERIVLKRK
ncbi:acyltransferase family protein [Anaeromicropila herbilytica]|nr:acyltransferase family protein [Anaeromicropila herbilytica]